MSRFFRCTHQGNLLREGPCLTRRSTENASGCVPGLGLMEAGGGRWSHDLDRWTFGYSVYRDAQIYRLRFMADYGYTTEETRCIPGLGLMEAGGGRWSRDLDRWMFGYSIYLYNAFLNGCLLIAYF
ncbi:hypothetical protein STAS_09853 [Striga asiatica]|uniref:Uncharacterized protein n=1 Tax=Striga asiatica TaxID=4170 RepID=A0A5A7PLU4_STRAF|nr:hypothetical protein STAS_09853 [Striga asiatica]